MDIQRLLHIAAQFMHGAATPDGEVEGLTLAAVIEQLLDAKEPDTPRFAAWYCREVLIPTGRKNEAIRILNVGIKADKRTPWAQSGFAEAMLVLVDVCPAAFTD